MAAVESVMLPLGTKAPDFTLMNASNGSQVDLNGASGERATVIMFICNHCPFVKHLISQVVDAANDYSAKGVNFIAISSNDVVNYPEDSPARMREYAEAGNYPFPYLYDETQAVAKAYQAVCTPDFFIFDANLELAYRGQFDDSRPGNGKPINGADIRAALDAMVAGNQPSEHQKPSIGCNIKWKN